MPQGYEICKCKKFAFIYSAEVVNKLPEGYSGELCPECKLWMCEIHKLLEAINQQNNGDENVSIYSENN